MASKMTKAKTITDPLCSASKTFSNVRYSGQFLRNFKSVRTDIQARQEGVSEADDS